MSRRVQGWTSTLFIVLIFLCVIGTSVGLSALGGVVAGQRERDTFVTQTVTTQLDEQYTSALADVDRGEYELAASRIHYILSVDPAYPGAKEQLERIAQGQNTIPATTIPNTTPLPPSDAENPDELYAEADELFQDRDWAGAITRLEELQALFPDYREVEVLSKLYEARVNLGLSYVRGDRLQEGIVLLEQAEDIQPLDDRAAGELRLADLYLNGLTYWNFDWNTVIQNLDIIYQTAPNYRDVRSRLVEAHTRFGDELAATSRYCAAVTQYEAAIDIETTNTNAQAIQDEAEDSLTDAEDFCDDPGLAPTTPPNTLAPGETPEPTATPAITPTPTLRPGEIP